MASSKEYGLGTFDGLWQAAQDVFGPITKWASPGPILAQVPGVHYGSSKCGALQGGPVGNLYCPTCGDLRRMFLQETYVAYRSFYPFSQGGIRQDAELLPGVHLHAVFGLKCVQCETIFTAVMYSGPNGESVCVLPSAYGGLTTPHAPESAKFYCDQAARAASVGAYTAALAMLRPAVDIVLESNGYTKKWLGDKLAALERDINDDTGALWARQYNHEFLIALKHLANDALHTRANQVSALAARQDEQLYRSSEISIAQLLETIYERPHREQDRLTTLQNAALPRTQK